MIGRVAIGVAILISALLIEAAGYPIVLSAIGILAGWLRALPPPTQHFAAIAGDWGWPLAALLIVLWLRRPLKLAMNRLAKRIETDDLNFWGASIKRGDYKIPLDSGEAESEASAFAPDDVRVIEELYEFAGDSDENADKLLGWISTHVDTKLDVMDFMAEPIFANDRAEVYKALIGDGNGR